MSETKRTIEIDEDFLEQLYGLVGKIPPGAKSINVDLLKDLILDIKRKMEQVKTEAIESVTQPKKRAERTQQLNDDDEENEKAILIVDDLGVITYQLGVMFRNLGYEVTTAKEIYDAVAKFKKRTYKMVVMDLFIPTEREGFLLLDELIKLSQENHTCIGVMTASSKKEYRQMCLKKGADFYIEKIENWQSELIEYCEKNSN